MRSSRLGVLGSFICFAAFGSAQNGSVTDAQADGFAGPVKSISTIEQRSDVHWVQPSLGAALIIPLWCRECAYTADGFRTRSGAIINGQFIGESISLTRDSEGRVTEILASNVQTGLPARHVVFGPFGKVEETEYESGKPSRKETFRYDTAGNHVEEVVEDAGEEVVSHTVSNFSRNDTYEESTSWGKDQHVTERSSFDYATGEQHDTAYDESGNVIRTWTYGRGKVTSFWQPPDASPMSFGTPFSDPKDKADVKSISCRGNGICEVSTVHFQWADAAKKNPSSIEWRDATGRLQSGAYYDYVFDKNGNWTHREISVWTEELGKRTPYETDERLITYWE